MWTTSARLHLTFRMFQFSLFVVSVVNLEKLQRFFSFIFFQVARVLPEILNWFATSLLGVPFSSSYNVSYFQSRSHFMMLPFCGYFYRVSHQQSNWNKFKDFETFEYYGVRIETFKLTAVEYRRMEKLDSKSKIRITWWKIRPGDPKICSI